VFVDFHISFRSFYSIINTPVYYHLWFIYSLFGVYLLIPIFRIFILNADEYSKYYFVIIWLIFESVITIFEKSTGLERQVDFVTLSGFIGYFIIGHIVGNLNISKKFINISKILLILSYTLTAFGIYFLSTQKGIFSNYLFSYLGLNIVFISVMFFVVFKNIFQNMIFINNGLGSKIINKLSSASLGIYFVHPIFLYHLKNNNFGFSLNALSGNPIFYIPYTAIVVFLLSFFTIWIVQKYL